MPSAQGDTGVRAARLHLTLNRPEKVCVCVCTGDGETERERYTQRQREIETQS